MAPCASGRDWVVPGEGVATEPEVRCTGRQANIDAATERAARAAPPATSPTEASTEEDAAEPQQGRRDHTTGPSPGREAHASHAAATEDRALHDRAAESAGLIC
jgi:hypothetical protein